MTTNNDREQTSMKAMNKPELFDSRKSMVNHYLKPKMVGCELGVFAGDFSKKLLETKPDLLFMVDLFQGTWTSGDHGYEDVGIKTVNLNETYHQLCAVYHDNPSVKVVKSDSVEFMDKMPNEYFDFVYIDGDHSYEGVLRDINSAYPKVKRGGWIMGHDYCPLFHGVMEAADEFCREKNLYIEALSTCRYPTFAIRK